MKDHGEVQMVATSQTGLWTQQGSDGSQQLEQDGGG